MIVRDFFQEFIDSPAGAVLKGNCAKTLANSDHVMNAMRMAFDERRRSAIEQVAPEEAWREVNAERCRHRDDAMEARRQNRALLHSLESLMEKSTDRPEKPEKPTIDVRRDGIDKKGVTLCRWEYWPGNAHYSTGCGQSVIAKAGVSHNLKIYAQNSKCVFCNGLITGCFK